MLKEEIKIPNFSSFVLWGNKEKKIVQNSVWLPKYIACLVFVRRHLSLAHELRSLLNLDKEIMFGLKHR